MGFSGTLFCVKKYERIVFFAKIRSDCVKSVNPFILYFIWKDYNKGFGGKYGIETSKKDKNAIGYERDSEQPIAVGTNYKPTKPDSKADVKGLKNRFENTSSNDEAKKRADEIRIDRLNKEKLEKEQEAVN